MALLVAGARCRGPVRAPVVPVRRGCRRTPQHSQGQYCVGAAVFRHPGRQAGAGAGAVGRIPHRGRAVCRPAQRDHRRLLQPRHRIHRLLQRRDVLSLHRQSRRNPCQRQNQARLQAFPDQRPGHRAALRRRLQRQLPQLGQQFGHRHAAHGPLRRRPRHR